MLYAKVSIKENVSDKDQDNQAEDGKGKFSSAGEEELQKTSLKEEEKGKHILFEAITWPKRIKENDDLSTGGKNAGVVLDDIEI